MEDVSVIVALLRVVCTAAVAACVLYVFAACLGYVLSTCLVRVAWLLRGCCVVVACCSVVVACLLCACVVRVW
jgi:hypothetical protein